MVKEQTMTHITFSMIKTHAVMAGNGTAILRRLNTEFEVVGIASGVMEPEMLHEFYAEHKGRPYWDDLINSVSGPVVALALKRPFAVKTLRKMIGATNCRQAESGTIRAMFGDKTGPVAWNAIHGSDSDESAARELKIVFPNVIKW
jgi:nucleoside-diphosphate kinase